MSDRRVPTQDQALASILREILDRLHKVENGGAIAGQVSFGEKIQIGDVLVSVTHGAGTARNVVFTNVLSGTSFTIPL